MQSQNVREYQLIRQEMINLKDCVTSYIGYVLGGTGLAIFGLTSLGASLTRLGAVVFASLILSIIVSLILLILFYKFNSHNRFAGYCKLLNHERYDLPDSLKNQDIHFMAWEICIERLRHSDIKPTELTDLVQTVDLEMSDKCRQNLEWLVKQYAGINPEIDQRKSKEGKNQIFDALMGKVRTNSWGFPSYVAAVFFVIIVGFWLAAFLGSLTISFNTNNSSAGVIWFSWSTLLFTTMAQIYFWNIFSKKLYTLLKGSATVDGFFWRFLPLRAAYLSEYKFKPNYVLVEERLDDARSEAEVVINPPVRQ